MKLVSISILLYFFSLAHFFKKAIVSRNESLEWGVLRKGSIGISGSNYKPPVPEKNEVERAINEILLSYKTSTEKAIDIFCLITYKQLFWDGNKRTALCATNKILLSSGNGIITIKDNVMYEFNELLCRMYNTGNKEELKTLIYEKALFGID